MPGRKGRSGRPKKPVVEDGGEKTLQPKGKPGRPKKISVPTIVDEEPDSSNVKLTIENDESNSENESTPNQSSSKSVQRARRTNPLKKQWDAIIGPGKPVMPKYRLPTRRVILQRYRQLSQTEISTQWKAKAKGREIIDIITGEVIHVWNSARVPIIESFNVHKKVKDVVDSFKKGRLYAKKGEKVKVRETETYQAYLDELCDISPTNVFDLMRSSKKPTWKEDFDFLQGQKKVPQVGHMEGVDKSLFEQEQKIENRRMKKQKQLHKELTRKEELKRKYEESEDITEDDNVKESYADAEDDEFIPKKRHRKTIHPIELKIDSKTIMKDTADLATRMNLSTNQQLAMVSKVVKVGGGSIKDNVFSRSTTRRHKEVNRRK